MHLILWDNSTQLAHRSGRLALVLIKPCQMSMECICSHQVFCSYASLLGMTSATVGCCPHSMSLPYLVHVKVQEFEGREISASFWIQNLILPVAVNFLLYQRLPFTFGWQELKKFTQGVELLACEKWPSLMSPWTRDLCQVLLLNNTTYR